MTKSKGRNRPHHQWSWVELELLKRNYADSLNADLAAALGLRVEQIHRMAHKLGLRKSIECIARIAGDRTRGRISKGNFVGFEKGHVPANKGLRRPGWTAGNMASTQFKKGQLPSTTLPIGSYRVNGDGFLEYKFGDEPGPYTKRWKPVHRMVWEQAHGPIPKGHVLRFKKGRHTTVLKEITLDSIELLTHAQNLALNSIHAIYPPELVKVTQLRGLLTRQINRKAKEAQEA